MFNIFNLGKVLKRVELRMDDAQSEFRKIREDINIGYELAKRQRDELLETKEQLLESNKLLYDMAHAAGGMLCRKDRDGRYLFVNEYQCTHFFGMKSSCLDSIIGKTDIDIINSYKENTGLEHTYGDCCVKTDDHCKFIGKRCLYVETGQIGDKRTILKLIKTPIYLPDGNDDGIVVFGWDVSILCDGLFDELNRGIKEGTVEQLDVNIYWVKDDHNCNIPISL